MEAKNALENYTYSLRNSLNDEKLKEKIPEADKKVVDDKVTEVIQWLDAHQSSEKEE
ncbi:Heat shock 70 kDa protein [Phytophthora palmivora]|uniref:Heat shock 70 kDa protein n=1 Tax=Phytophthora palmivora TaxID=4796 RepID=A0A2P4YQ21_9STRA|nr:Heat shock 70 kDa protein [Phytophthora palmivora]